MSNTINYLQNKEWSMGNGQCPECCGVSPGWLGHPLHLTPETVGHKKNCPLAAALEESGVVVVREGQYKSPLVYEMYITENGLLSTRPKTLEGCPKIKQSNKEYRDKIREIIYNYLQK